MKVWQPPRHRRQLQAVHQGIAQASIDGRYDDAQALLATAPAEYQAVQALMGWLLRCKDVRACG